MNEVRKVVATPLPKTVEEMLSQRTKKVFRNLNDEIDALHIGLYSTNAEYMALLEAVTNAGAKEGRLIYDDSRAAILLRDYAKETGNDYVASKRIGEIVHSLRVVLKWYNISRTQRAATVHDEVVPNVEEDNDKE